jgi:hypothetical protein
LYGRLIESFGRGHIRLYCCSNTMVDAVARGDVLLAYNVQLSYAYAAQRRHEDVGVIVPRDYQAVQTRSAMVAKDAVRPDLARSFLAFLISPEGQAIASRILTPPVPDARASFTLRSGCSARPMCPPRCCGCRIRRGARCSCRSGCRRSFPRAERTSARRQSFDSLPSYTVPVLMEPKRGHGSAEPGRDRTSAPSRGFRGA